MAVAASTAAAFMQLMWGLMANRKTRVMLVVLPAFPAFWHVIACNKAQEWLLRHGYREGGCGSSSNKPYVFH